MAELRIPEASYRAMLDAQDDWDDDEILANSIREVASPIVAAELRRLADEDQQKADRWKGRERETVPGSQAAAHAAAFIARHETNAARLRARADELDGGAR